MNDRTKIAIAATGLAAGLVAKTLYDRSRERSLLGEVVLVADGQGGFGTAVANRFAREGCRVAICASAEEDFQGAREGIFTTRCDVTKRSEVESAIAEVIRHFGKIDILVTHTGSVKPVPAAAAPIDDFERAMSATFWSTVYPALAALPEFRKRKSGQIVNIGSIGVAPGSLALAAARQAADGFTEALRTELAPSGITVTNFSAKDSAVAAREAVSIVKRREAPGVAKSNPIASFLNADLLELAGNLLVPKTRIRAALTVGKIAARYFQHRTA
jgi:NAD(P)-dependent dehydrogenase (short-subunit alcohol dehydrogenase family)